jgi:hypothetical protein
MQEWQHHGSLESGPEPEPNGTELSGPSNETVRMHPISQKPG